MPGEPLRLDGYVRVSKIGGRSGDGFISPDVQRDQIGAWATLMGADIVQWHEDLDVSGGNTDRPAFTEALRRIDADECDGIVVAKIDRFARNAVDGLMIVRDLKARGKVFASAAERIDPTTPVGQAMLGILFVFAELQLDTLKSGWDIATERSVARGVHSQVPFGYRKSAGKGSPLAPDPGTREILPQLFARRIAGESWAALARWLDTQAPPAKGGLWTHRTVQDVIHNPAYKGEARYGRHVNSTAHDALVGADLWDAAQVARGVRPSRGATALLSGLVRCAGCRHRMQPASVGAKKIKVYRCKRRYNAGVCTAPAYIQRALIEDHVERLFLQRYAGIDLEAKVSSQGLDAARARLADAEAELAAYRDNTAARALLERLGDDSFEAGLGTRVDAVLSARAAFEQVRRETTGVSLGPALDAWPDLPVETRRSVMAEGIDAVVLRRADIAGGLAVDRRVKVFWRGEAPTDLPGPGVRIELRGINW